MDIPVDQKLVQGLVIPPRPEVVTVLFEEMSRDEPDLMRVAKAISADVGLAGAMLKAVNSPLFGLTRKAQSVNQAVNLLGLRNVGNIATGLVIRQTLNGAEPPMLQRFWDTAEKVAALCVYLARKLRGIPSDEAYTYGLFHDCGIPLLMGRFPNYREVLIAANQAADRSFIAVEEEALGTHHCAVGYFLARSWGLGDDLCQAILLHHDVHIFSDPKVSGTTRSFAGIGHMAAHIHHQLMRSTVDVEWIKFEEAICSHFALTEEDMLGLVDGATDIEAQASVL